MGGRRPGGRGKGSEGGWGTIKERGSGQGEGLPTLFRHSCIPVLLGHSCSPVL